MLFGINSRIKTKYLLISIFKGYLINKRGNTNEMISWNIYRKQIKEFVIKNVAKFFSTY